MSVNLRRKKRFRKFFLTYILLAAVLGCSAFFLNAFFTSRKPLFLSPLGKIKIDKTYVERKLKDSGILFSEIALLNNFCLVRIQNSGQVRFSRDKDMGKQITSLQRILRELTIEGKPFKSIDLRFAEPVISF